MYVNNEIGVIQEIPKIGEIAHSQNIVFFCDATQAIGKVPVDIEKDNLDLLCFSGHKMNGPKGIGALYIKKNIKISPLIHGGGQEKGLRGGTHNTPLIVGFGEATRIAREEFNQRVDKLNILRREIENYFIDNDLGSINFSNQPRAPHILSISIKNGDAEDFLITKNQEFVASTGSACNSGIVEQSQVIKALRRDSNKFLRISL
jgi:cysteine desulfurase